MDQPDARPIALGRTLNCRDVGGYVTATGPAIRPGLLFRSDLPVVDDEDRHHAEALQLRTVIDLREPEERSTRPARLPATGAEIVSIPLGLGPLVAADPSRASSLTALYRTAILKTGGQIVAVVRELAKPGALPALVHCAAGKDRTGIVIAVLLSALGIPDGKIAHDYAMSARCLTPKFFEDLDRETVHARGVNLTALHAAEPEDITQALALVRHVAGDAQGYLLRHGVEVDELERLRASLVT